MGKRDLSYNTLAVHWVIILLARVPSDLRYCMQQPQWNACTCLLLRADAVLPQRLWPPRAHVFQDQCLLWSGLHEAPKIRRTLRC